MHRLADDRRQELLEEAYDRKDDPLLSAAYLILAAHDELRDAATPLDQQLRSRIGELFDSVRTEVLQRLEASLTTARIVLPDIEER